MSGWQAKLAGARPPDTTGMRRADPVAVDIRRQWRMHLVDSMSPELRKCVHDYGLTVVAAFIQLGIEKPRHIRHLVETVLNEFSPTRGACSQQGTTRARGMSDPTREGGGG